MWNQQQVDRVSQQIMARSSTDPLFRRRCLNDPQGVVREISGEDLPSGMTIRFIDKGTASFSYVLPDLVTTEGQLSDSELEQVAGGGRCGGTCSNASSVGLCG